MVHLIPPPQEDLSFLAVDEFRSYLGTWNSSSREQINILRAEIGDLAIQFELSPYIINESNDVTSL